MSSVALCLSIIVVLDYYGLDCRPVPRQFGPVSPYETPELDDPFPDFVDACVHSVDTFFLQLGALRLRINALLKFIIFNQLHPSEPMESKKTAGSDV